MTTLVDTSFLVSLANPRELSHRKCLAVAQSIRTALLIPVTVLPEAAYLIGDRLGHRAMRQFVHSTRNPAWTFIPLLNSDLERAAELLDQYYDAKLDFVDATIITMAERLNVRRILTLDRRHFELIRPRHIAAFELLPAL
jgi:predicted nucleic acid-binding protein